MTKGKSHGTSGLAVAARQSARAAKDEDGKLEDTPGAASGAPAIRGKGSKAAVSETGTKHGNNTNSSSSGSKSTTKTVIFGVPGCTEEQPEAGEGAGGSIVDMAGAQAAVEVAIDSYEHGHETGYAQGRADERDLQAKVESKASSCTLLVFQAATAFLVGVAVGLLATIIWAH